MAFLFGITAACASVPKFSVRGGIADQDVRTAVDSEIAKYYLEQYLATARIRPADDARIEGALKAQDDRALDRDSLRELTHAFSPDFATLYFLSRLYADPRNQRAQRAFHAHLASLKTGSREGRLRLADRLRSYLLAFVPGYAYKKDPTTGADFARQRQILNDAGIRTVLIETGELDTVEKNALLVRDALRGLRKTHDNIILVSTSKGGPEVALAIGTDMSPGETQHIKAWISIGGLLRGSPSADLALQWPTRWIVSLGFFLKGLSPDVIENLSTEKRRAVFDRLRFPPHLLMLQYVAVPLSGHIADYLQGRYDDLKAWGPNDGLTLLADELIPEGIVITDVGLDHYYLDPDIDLKTFALAGVVLEEVALRAAGPQRTGKRGGALPSRMYGWSRREGVHGIGPVRNRNAAARE